MGTGLADNVSQGGAGGDQFRSAPLWGLGQRIFFLHDGRTNDLLQAIKLHASGNGTNASEANEVIENFNKLNTTQQQQVLAAQNQLAQQKMRLARAIGFDRWKLATALVNGAVETAPAPPSLARSIPAAACGPSSSPNVISDWPATVPSSSLAMESWANSRVSPLPPGSRHAS